MALYSNMTGLPPLPEYTLKPLPALFAPIPDKVLPLLMPFVAYWVVSMFFHWIDVKDYFAQYRLHTPAEVLKRNRVSRYEVVRDVLIQQVIQTFTGLALVYFEPDDVYGREEYDVAVWGQRVRLAQRAIPVVLGTMGVDALELSKKVAASYPSLAGAIAGGVYPSLYTIMSNGGVETVVPALAPWEQYAASALYWVIIPIIQYAIAIFTVDTWQYFLHRAMHINKWLYTTFHSRHHRLYVPYAFGALYNHPFEGFLLDTVGAGLGFKLSGMTTRQGMCFFTGSTIKTVDDHCGYALPFDPLQHITSNNAGYHDVHHQSWGIKTNFSQPFFTFWDHLLGTVWVGGDVSARYQRDRIAAQKKVDAETKSVTGSGSPTTHVPNPYKNEIENATKLKKIPQDQQQPHPPAGKAEQQAAGSREQVLEEDGASILRDETSEEKDARKSTRKSKRSKAHSITQSDSLRGLRERVSAHGRTGGVLGMDHQ